MRCASWAIGDCGTRTDRDLAEFRDRGQQGERVPGACSSCRVALRGQAGGVSALWQGKTWSGWRQPVGAGRLFPWVRRSWARGRASRSWVWGAMISQVQRSAASGSRSLGWVQPRVCLNSRKVCSRSKRRRKTCRAPVDVPSSAPVFEDDDHTAGAARSFDKRSTSIRINVPSTSGSSPSWSSQAARWVSRGWTRCHACVTAVP